MDSILIIVERARLGDALRRIPGDVVSQGDVDRDSVVLEWNGSSCYLDTGDFDESEWDELELAHIRSVINSPTCMHISFSDPRACKHVVESIADTRDVLVDDDFGNVRLGEDFVELSRKYPGWEWRRARASPT